jgi:hypothetical protein
MSVRSRPDHPAKNELGEYATFEAALKKVLSVPHAKIKRKLDTEKRKRTKASAYRAANAKD